MKIKLSKLAMLLALLICSISTNSIAQSQSVMDLKNSVNIALDNVTDRICCYSSCNPDSERGSDCKPRTIDPGYCGECKNQATGEVGVYTQDISEPTPDTTFADAIGKLLSFNDIIRQKISESSTKLAIANQKVNDVGADLILKNDDKTRKDRQKYKSALTVVKEIQTDLSILQDLQSKIFKLSSDLFLLSFSKSLKSGDQP